MSLGESVSLTLWLELTFTAIITLMAWHLWRVYPGRSGPSVFCWRWPARS
jgi:hypothetical protein